MGVSISLGKILSSPRLPNRALQALILLLAILVMCSVLLVPGQPIMVYGVEVLALGLLLWIMVTGLDVNSVRKSEPHFRRVSVGNLVLNQIAMLPYIIVGIAVLTSGGNGFYRVVPGIMFSLVKALLDA
jgi:modulator of FtsH protease